MLDPSWILEKLRWESGPTSIPHLGEIIPIIENTLAQIKALESRRDSLQIYANQLQALISPVRKIPDEILQRIFDDSCDMNTVTEQPPNMPPCKRPAMALSGVCSRWRRNALSLHAIWSRISVVCGQMTLPQVEHNSNLINIFLDRALHHPLTIVIKVGCELQYTSFHLSSSSSPHHRSLA